MRKIIQIVHAEGHYSRGTYALCAYALCDDGTVWRLEIGPRWERMPPIPQDEEEKDAQGTR